MGLEKEIKKEYMEDIVIGKKKIWTLSYANDVVLLAEKNKI